MKRIKFILLLCFVIVLLIIFIIVFLKKGDKKRNKIIEPIVKNEVDESITIETKKFFLIEKMVQGYIDSIDNEEKLFNLTDNSFIKNNNLDKISVLKLLSIIPKNVKFWALSIKLNNKNENINNYGVKGIITDSSNNFEEEIFFIVRMDEQSLLFSIIPSNEVEYKQEYVLDRILLNDYNEYAEEEITDKTLLEKYLQYYRYNTFCNIEKAYNMLDNNYRNNRFNGIEDYKKYIESNEIIRSIKLQKYIKNKIYNLVQYVCTDFNDNYYIINEKSVMDYTIMLDNYTIDLPQFVEKYNKANKQEKVALNINKFILAINDKSYNFAYNLLAESFKNNKFKTVEDFENYIKNNLFEKNKVEYSTFSNEGDNYIYNLIISDANEESDKIIKCTVIMQLKEGTDFVMSFNIE